MCLLVSGDEFPLWLQEAHPLCVQVITAFVAAMLTSYFRVACVVFKGTAITTSPGLASASLT